jgi:hypothetical protein
MPRLLPDWLASSKQPCLVTAAGGPHPAARPVSLAAIGRASGEGPHHAGPVPPDPAQQPGLRHSGADFALAGPAQDCSLGWKCLAASLAGDWVSLWAMSLFRRLQRLLQGRMAWKETYCV